MAELFYEMKTKQDEEQFSMIGFSSLYTSPLHQEFDTFSFPVNNYPLDYVLHDQPIVIPGSQSSIDFHQFPPPLPPLPEVQVAAGTVEDMKKKNHSANERMRRMKLNRLFDALRSVLPGAEHMKKLGAPATVDNVIKYVPELRMEVEALTHKKQQLVTAMTTTNDVVFSAAPSAWTNDTTVPSSSSSLPSFTSLSVQVTKLGNAEVSIQISSPKSLINTFIPITEVLRKLEEEDGLLVVEFSSSDSSAVRIFYYMHLIKEEEANEIDCESLRKKLIFSCQQWEKMCFWMISQG